MADWALRRRIKRSRCAAWIFGAARRGLIRENWVLTDLLHVYEQIGVNIFDRMRELTVARQGRMAV